MDDAPRNPPPKRKRRRKKRVLPRSSILFFFGIGVIANEAGPWNHDKADAFLLLTGLVLCGLPVADLADIFRNTITQAWYEPEPDDPDGDGDP